MLYCGVHLMRAGLTNRFFPWARCRIYSHLHGTPMLAPQWLQLPNRSAILARQMDLRTYRGLFVRRAGDVSGLRNFAIQLRARRVMEPGSLTDAIEADDLALVLFKGFGRHFEPLHGWHAFIREELLAITNPRWLQRVDEVKRPFVGIHVRRGDFQRTASESFSGGGNISTPLAWFVGSLKAVRAQLGEHLPAIVTSDGTAEELRELLELGSVRLVSTGSAISDLITLSRSSLLLGSGSSFSAWASYLGQMPTLTHPGQNLTDLFRLDAPGSNRVSGFDPADKRVPALDGLVLSG